MDKLEIKLPQTPRRDFLGAYAAIWRNLCWQPCLLAPLKKIKIQNLKIQKQRLVLNLIIHNVSASYTILYQIKIKGNIKSSNNGIKLHGLALFQ